MAKSHRNNDVEVRTWNLRLIGLVALGVLGALVTVWGVVLLTGDGENALPDPGAKRPLPTATITIEANPSASPSKPDSESSKVSPVEPAPPRRLVIEGVVDTGFANAVADGESLEAENSDRLSRLESRGLPGSPGTDTVVLIGEDRFDRNAVLNDIADAEVDQTIRLETGEGTLTYTIDEVMELASDQVQGHPAFTSEDGNRLLIVALTFDDQGERTGTDTVLAATLTGAERT